MIKTTMLLLLFAAPQTVFSQIEKRVGRLENRVDNVESRVSTLESDKPSALEDAAALKTQPFTVKLISKQQVVRPGKVAVQMVLEFTNHTSYLVNGFSGKLVFKPLNGDIYTRSMSYSHPIGSGESMQMEFVVSANQTKQYLKFVKATQIKVVLINQKIYN